jgi:hypothetical protein
MEIPLMHRPRATTAALRSTVLVLGLLVPVGCSSAATGTPATTDSGSVSGPATVEPQVTLPAGTSPQAGAPLPADPCAPTIAAIKSLGWLVTKAEGGPGPGGPNTQCTFQADRGDNSFDNGWVAYIPASQMALEYHQPEAIAGVGVEAFRGSPQSGEILATGASPGFRLFVASGDDAALKFAKALVNGS